MASIKISLIFVFSLLLLSFTNCGKAIEDFHQWCRKTTHSQICISIISQYPAEYLKRDPTGCCWILNDKARDIAGSALNNISDLLKGSVGSYDKDLLQHSYALYSDIDYIVYNFDFSVLNHQNYPLFNRDLKKAILIYERK
jgi:pectinesterase inhibitor-like protein